MKLFIFSRKNQPVPDREKYIIYSNFILTAHESAHAQAREALKKYLHYYERVRIF